MNLDPIAYTGDADIYCPGCAMARYGREPGFDWVRANATDGEGNAIGAVFDWGAYEWCGSMTPETKVHVLYCGGCRGPIDLHESRDCPVPPARPGGAGRLGSRP